MKLLSDGAPVFLDGSSTRRSFRLYKTGSAENHATSDDVTLKQALMQAMSAPVGPNKNEQERGVFRVKINSGLGYLVYKLGVDTNVTDSAAIFHYHWNYNLDLPLTAT
jgi:hypothetical protein